VIISPDTVSRDISGRDTIIDSLPPPSTSALIQGLDEDLNDEDKEELQTLKRMVIRKQQLNRYFTADEDNEVEGLNDTNSNSKNDIDSD
jgi:hypothetical protein